MKNGDFKLFWRIPEKLGVSHLKKGYAKVTLSIESKDYGKAPAFKMNFVRFLQDTTMYEKLEQWTQTSKAQAMLWGFLKS